MYAIVEIAGQQFKVEQGKKVYVHRLAAEEGAKVEFDKVLLIEDGANITVGTPVVEGAKVTASVVEHVKADKVIVFRKKRRKTFERKNGHRQCMTQILIENIANA